LYPFLKSYANLIYSINIIPKSKYSTSFNSSCPLIPLYRRNSGSRREKFLQGKRLSLKLGNGVSRNVYGTSNLSLESKLVFSSGCSLSSGSAFGIFITLLESNSWCRWRVCWVCFLYEEETGCWGFGHGYERLLF
jgi:hypothetical protein